MSAPVLFEILILAAITIFLLGAFGALASEVGADSREMSDDPHRSYKTVALS
jgi:hypothetical protein